MFKFTGTLLHLDGIPDLTGEYFDENSMVELPSHDVSVTLDFHEGPEFWLGKAKLYFRPGKLCYIMELLDERLPKYALETLTPCVGGHVKSRNGNRISYVSVSGIGLSASGNADSRIKPLKDQK
jgi:hypothetical protein